MTGAPFDVTNVRRVKIVQECSTSVDLRDVVERRILMNARFQKTMTARILKDSLLLMTIICLISVVGAAETADNTEYEIDKVYGRPNIEQMYPTHMDDGTTAYRRSNEIHRKRESNRQMIDTAYHYNGPNNLNSIILNKIGHSPRTFHYKEENGCDKTIHYVLWPFLNNEPQFHSQQYYKAKFGDGLAYHPDLQRFPYGTSLKKQLVSDYQDKKTVEHHIYGSSHGQQPLLVDSSSLEQQLPPINHKNNIGVIYNAHAEKNHADKLKKYDSTQPVNEDYVPRPAGGYGFKKLIVPVEDAYNQKAYRPPRFDLSDFLFPAEENDFYTQPLPYDVDNVNKVPDYTPQPSSHSSYKEHNADLVDQTLYSKKSREYVGGSHEYADGGIDKFGPLPFKEKINYDGHKKSKKYSIKNNQLYDSHSVEEDYTPNERDEFGELPYKERVVSSENSEEYDDHSPVSYTEQPASSTPVFESSHALLLSSSWNVDDTTSTINPSTIFTSTTTAGVTSTTNQPVIAALMAVDYMAALARAEEEAKKLTEPGPQAVCPGQRTAIQNCSSFFTCNSTGTLVSCWAELGSDDPSQLVFDPTSQECRKFSAIKECTMENVCANGSKFTLLGGECTRLAYNCPGEIITCGAGHAVDSATHACVPETSQLACSPLLQRLQNQ